MVPRPNIRGIPEIMVYRILMFMWSFGPLSLKDPDVKYHPCWPPDPIMRDPEAQTLYVGRCSKDFVERRLSVWIRSQSDKSPPIARAVHELKYS